MPVSNIQKLKILFWSMLTVAAMAVFWFTLNKNTGAVCESCSVIHVGSDVAMMDDGDVIRMIGFEKNIKGKQVSSIELNKLETVLEADPWVKRADMFFDNARSLQVKLIERVPIGRVFSDNGQSFYIDSSGARLPLKPNKYFYLPVFTNFPSEFDPHDARDSSLMLDVSTMARFISADSFWKSQIAQINIEGRKNFELIPVVGDHIVVFGGADQLKAKFHRLQVFYTRALAKTGIGTYKKLDVRFRGQIVATHTSAPNQALSDSSALAFAMASRSDGMFGDDTRAADSVSAPRPKKPEPAKKSFPKTVRPKIKGKKSR